MFLQLLGTHRSAAEQEGEAVGDGPLSPGRPRQPPRRRISGRSRAPACEQRGLMQGDARRRWLSIDAPTPEDKIACLKEIAAEHEVLP